ncbi:MAG: aldose 1-epimerase family protein [Prevotella sp.]|nr:aldose 1-epimerase family protein [Prevotella sp.]
MEQLKNDFLTIEASPLGAELQSIKDTRGHEYLWQADPDCWARHSPILFPIVCGLWEGKYRIDGFEYAMERHGFARDTEFKLVQKTDTKVTFALTDSPETRRKYPYKFNLAITYRLNNNKIHVIWHVENTDNNEIHFQIGGHPAFNVPGAKKGEILKGTLRFDNPTPERIYGNMNGCLVKGYHRVPTKDGIWEFTEDDFADDAIIFDRCQIKQVTLLNTEKKPVVIVDLKSPALGIWSPAGKHAPFVCIEPWYGIHDWAAYQGDFRQKYLMNHLQPGASFMSEYTITIGK